LRAKGVRSLEDARSSRVRELRLTVEETQLDSGLKKLLSETLRTAGGGQCPVVMRYRQAQGSALMRLGTQWSVNPSDALLDQLRGLMGGDAVELLYENQ